MNQDKIYNWGILSTGNICNDFTNALNNVKSAKILAVGARSLESA